MNAAEREAIQVDAARRCDLGERPMSAAVALLLDGLRELTDKEIAEVRDILGVAEVAPETPAWLNASQAAKHLGTSRDRIYDLVQLGKLKPHRDGRRLLFKPSDLDTYLNGQI